MGDQIPASGEKPSSRMPVVRLRKAAASPGTPVNTTEEEETAKSLVNSLDLLEKCQVKFDQEKGEFVGLPPPWQQLLLISNITKKEQRENPEAVLNSLKLYTRLVNQRPSFARYMIVTKGSLGSATGAGMDVTDSADVEMSAEDVTDSMSDAMSDEVDYFCNIRPRVAPVEKTDTEVYETLKRLASPGSPRDNYEIQRKLGQGAYGVVSLGQCRTTGQEVAIKEMDLNRQSRKEYLVTEIEVMKKLRHDNIVNFLDCYYSGDKLWLVMEFLDGGPLTEIVTRFELDENQIATVSIQCLQGLQYLHEKNIIHRDIKSDNVLTGSSGVIKLTDFGFCAQLDSARRMRQTELGTLLWMAPEVAKRQAYNNKIDIWSFGIMLIEMLEGAPPHMNETPIRTLLYLKTKGKPDIKNEDKLSPELKEFIDMCLEVDMYKRAKAKQLLKHPLLKKALPRDFLRDLVKAAQEAMKKDAAMH